MCQSTGSTNNVNNQKGQSIINALTFILFPRAMRAISLPFRASNNDSDTPRRLLRIASREMSHVGLAAKTKYEN